MLVSSMISYTDGYHEMLGLLVGTMVGLSLNLSDGLREDLGVRNG